MSSVKSYLGIDKREGLVGIGKRIVNRMYAFVLLNQSCIKRCLDISTEALEVRWQKSFKAGDKLLHPAAESAIAISAFMLTTLPTSMAQRALVEEMWASGAHTIVLIDHDTTEGFKAIACAREHILELSKLELSKPETETDDSEITSDGPIGCHILAPVSIAEKNLRSFS
jgi:ribosomal protein RSM22 (predicted rRNA methylase)